jgi:hypothetical protein
MSQPLSEGDRLAKVAQKFGTRGWTLGKLHGGDVEAVDGENGFGGA